VTEVVRGLMDGLYPTDLRISHECVSAIGNIEIHVSRALYIFGLDSKQFVSGLYELGTAL